MGEPHVLGIPEYLLLVEVLSVTLDDQSDVPHGYRVESRTAVVLADVVAVQVQMCEDTGHKDGCIMKRHSRALHPVRSSNF